MALSLQERNDVSDIAVLGKSLRMAWFMVTSGVLR
jgi:hypothetical protein